MAQLEPWWSGLTYLFAKEAGLNGPRGFESLRFRNQHNDMDNILTNSSVAENIYKILTRKDFRNGPLPDGIRKDLVIKNIQEKVNRNLPIKFLQSQENRVDNLFRTSLIMCAFIDKYLLEF